MLAVLVMILGSGQALAQDSSCNPSANMTILTGGPFFLDDTLRVSANIGAGPIRGGSYLDIHAFGFAQNCHKGQGFASCRPEPQDFPDSGLAD